VNKVIITGRLTSDAEQRTIPSGTAILSFSVANNTGYGDKEKVHYFNCSLFGKRAEGRLQEFMKKGQLVAVEGEVSLNTYTKKDGTGGSSLNVFVQNVELMGGKNDVGVAPAPAQAKKDEDFDQDVPF